MILCFYPLPLAIGSMPYEGGLTIYVYRIEH